MEQTAARQLAKKLNERYPDRIHVAMTWGVYLGRWSKGNLSQWIVVDRSSICDQIWQSDELELNGASCG